MAWQCSVTRVVPSADEREAVWQVVDRVLAGHDTIALSELFDDAGVVAEELPRSIRAAFRRFRLHQSSHALCVAMGPFNDELIGRTPERHRDPGEIEKADQHDVLHILFASLLGEPFGWSSIQSGYVINDVMPVREHENIVASSGYGVDFDLHTEDAFHRWAGDYLGLMCLRNVDEVPTRLAGFDASELSESTRAVLAQPRFTVGANVAQVVPKVETLSPILFGNLDYPYFRINLNQTTAAPDDDEAKAALDQLVGVLRRNVQMVTFSSGDYWYIDNLKVAHGRDRFHPRFDGLDRWLRRLYISSAYRYTTGFRETPGGRLLQPTTKEGKAA